MAKVKDHHDDLKALDAAIDRMTARHRADLAEARRVHRDLTDPDTVVGPPGDEAKALGDSIAKRLDGLDAALAPPKAAEDAKAEPDSKDESKAPAAAPKAEPAKVEPPQKADRPAK